MEERQKAKRKQPGIVQANDNRPRSGRSRTAQRDDASRPLVQGSSNTSSQPMYPHGKELTFQWFTAERGVTSLSFLYQ